MRWVLRPMVIPTCRMLASFRGWARRNGFGNFPMADPVGQPWVVQLSNDHLFPLEQIAVGGRYSVRGYREFTLIRDNAAMGSIEARCRSIRRRPGSIRSLAPFFDFGHGWQTSVPDAWYPSKTLAECRHRGDLEFLAG